ncbi:MAG TPA: DUF481 domain-containing protein [Thermoanaerobaculia bacterium]
MCPFRSTPVNGSSSLRPTRFPQPLAAGLLLILFFSTALRAQKTDVIVLDNGDRLTGEIKAYGKGRLTLDTSAVSYVKVKWNKIVSITSDKLFDLQTIDGTRYFGTLAPSEPPGKLVIDTAAGKITLDFFEVFLLSPLYQNFWRRWDGSLDLGFNYTESSQLTQFNLNANGIYRRPKFSLETDISATYSRQNGVTGASRGTYSLAYFRFLSDRWFVATLFGLDRNIQLGLDLRVLAAVGGGRNLIQTNQTLLATYLGVAVNHEQPVEGESKYNSEAVIGGKYSYFMYDFPKITLGAALAVYPSLTEGGRVRLEANASAKREIVSDFYISLSIFDSYDSRNPTTGQAKNDWGPTLSVGWQF